MTVSVSVGWHKTFTRAERPHAGVLGQAPSPTIHYLPASIQRTPYTTVQLMATAVLSRHCSTEAALPHALRVVHLGDCLYAVWMAQNIHQTWTTLCWRSGPRSCFSNTEPECTKPTTLGLINQCRPYPPQFCGGTSLNCCFLKNLLGGNNPSSCTEPASARANPCRSLYLQPSPLAKHPGHL